MQIGGERGLARGEFRRVVVFAQQLLSKVGALAARRGLDGRQDRGDAVGEHHAECVTKRLVRADEEHALAVLEEVQPRLVEIRAQVIHDLLRERHLILPCRAHRAAHMPVHARTARGTAAFQRQGARHESRQVVLFEVLLGLEQRRESHRLSFLQGRPGGAGTRLLLPIGDGLLVAHDRDLLRLEFLERHPPAVALLVELAQRGLVAVVVCRPQQRTRGAAAGDVPIAPFDLLTLHGFLAIELLPRRQERVALDGRAVERNRPGADLVQQHSRVHRSEPHAMPLRALQEELRSAEHGIGAPARLDLPRDPCPRCGFGQKLDLQLRRCRPRVRARLARRTVVLPAVVAAKFTRPAIIRASRAGRTIRARPAARPVAALRRTRPAALATATAWAGRTPISAAPATVVTTATTALPRVALMVGIAVLRRALFQPVGKKFQVKLLGQITHGRT